MFSARVILLLNASLLIFAESVITSGRQTSSYMERNDNPSTTFPEDTFILSLISQDKFSKCSLVILQDRFDNNESVSRILHSVAFMSPNLKSAYSIKYKFPDSATIREIQTKLNMMNLMVSGGDGPGYNGNLTEALPSKDTLPVQFKISVSNFRRKSDPCQIIILMINDVRPVFMKQIFNLLTPVYIPLTRKDEDFYIFKSDSEYHERLLLMHDLPSRTKFKIAVGAVKQNNKSDKESAITVSTVCFFCNRGGNPKLIHLPVKQENLAVPGVDYFPDFIWNLNGKLLHVSFPYIRSKIEGDPPWEGTMNARRGSWKWCFEEYLMPKFNFTYHMFAATGIDGSYGGGGTGLQLENGTWTGITGDLISGKADLGIAIANTPKRILYIDYCDALFSIVWLTFVTSQPSRLYSPAALLWPFDWTVWASTAASTLFAIIFFFSIFKIMQVYQFGSGEKWSLSLQIQFLLSVFLEQDSPVLPESPALRCFVALWFFYTMILVTYYRTKMTTLLAFPVLGNIPKSFEELIFSDYKVGFMKHGDSAYNTLAASTDPVYVKLVAETEIFRDYGLECIEKVVNSKYGCIGYDSSMLHVIERNLSEADTQKLVFAPATTYSIGLGMGTEGKSIYRINFGKVLRYTRPFHLVDIWDKWDMYYNVRMLKLDWWKRTGQKGKTKRQEKESEDLSMKHIAGAFYVLIVCLLVSTVAIVMEIMYFHRNIIFHGFFSLVDINAVSKKVYKFR